MCLTKITILEYIGVDQEAASAEHPLVRHLFKVCEEGQVNVMATPSSLGDALKLLLDSLGSPLSLEYAASKSLE